MAEETVSWPEDYMHVATCEVRFNSMKSTAGALWASALRQQLVIMAPAGGRAWIPMDDDSGGYIARDFAQYVEGFKGRLSVMTVAQIRPKQMERIRAAQEKIKSDQGANEIAATSLMKEQASSSSKAKPVSRKERKRAAQRQVTQKPKAEEALLAGDGEEPQPDEEELPAADDETLPVDEAPPIDKTPPVDGDEEDKPL